MAVGKNKKLGKKKKAAGKKATDPFAKKEWYDVKAPSVFQIRNLGHTVVTKTAGQKIARDSLVGRVFESSLGDLKESAEDDAFRKFRFKVEDVAGNQCLTSFYGMAITTDKMRSLVRKWHTLIEAYADVKTTDGHYLRLFCIGFTKRRPNQARKTSYAQHSQVRAIRKKMIEVMQKEAQAVELSAFTQLLVTETIGREIEKATQGIYPLQNVLIRKVKVLRSPKLDVGKLYEAHGGAEQVQADQGSKVDRPEEVKPDSKKKAKAAKAAKKAKDAEEEGDE
jgi:small subunit ribosomal protein S3Ae